MFDFIHISVNDGTAGNLPETRLAGFHQKYQISSKLFLLCKAGNAADIVFFAKTTCGETHYTLRHGYIISPNLNMS